MPIKNIGKYAIEAEIGRGAFGAVYRAFDPSMNRRVAIKKLVAADNPEILGRFRLEAGMTASLVHKNIVTVHEFLEENDSPYLVMELLDGQTLQQLIASKSPLGILEKVEIMYQVAEGLQHAHAKGVIHRDMKPGNVMVLPNGGAKIMDFGIARLLNQDSSWRTRQGDLAGTVPYMAPEQLRGEQVDKLVDIFSYGVVYYELLSGDQPFQAEGVAAVMYRINTYDPPPLRQVDDNIPPALEDLVQRLMMKERDLRIDKMEDVLFDTQPILQQLRQARAREIAVGVGPLIDAGDFPAALILIERVLHLDPFHTEARQWRDRVQAQARREALRGRVESMIREGQAHLAARRFAECIPCFESAFQLDKTRTEIRGWIDQAKTLLSNARESARMVAEARWKEQQKQFPQALEAVTTAIELDPGNAEALRLRDDLNRLLAAARISNVKSRALAASARGDYEEALSVLIELDSEPSARSEAEEMRSRIEADRAEAERRRRAAEFRIDLAAAREQLSIADGLDAEKIAEQLCAKYPDEPNALDLLHEIQERLAAQRRVEAISKTTQSARLSIQEKRFEQAVTVLMEGLRSFPGDVSMQKLLEMAKALRAARERGEKLDAVLKRVNELREKGELEDALAAVDTAESEFGEFPELRSARTRIEADREQRDYALSRDRILVEAMIQVANENVEGAIDLLEHVSPRFANDPELIRTLNAARDTKKALHWVQERRDALAAIASLESAGKLTEGLMRAERSLVDHPGDTALEQAALRIREKIRVAERKREFAERISRIEKTIAKEDWEKAAAALTEAHIEFPGAPELSHFSAQIEVGRAKIALKQLEDQIKEDFTRGDLKGVAKRLAETRARWSSDEAWQRMLNDLDRRLAVGDRLADGVSWLEELARAHPDDENIKSRLTAARTADQSRVKRKVLVELQSRVGNLEAEGKLADAIRLIDESGSEDTNLKAAAERMAAELRRRGQEEAVARIIRGIETEVAAGNWDAALAQSNEAQAEFGDHPAFSRYPAAIHQARSTKEIGILAPKVRKQIAKGGYDAAVSLLTSNRDLLSGEPAWKALWEELNQVLTGGGTLTSVNAIETLAAQHAQEPELTKILKSARDTLTARRDKTLQELVKASEKLEAEGRLEVCAPGLEEACQADPEHVALASFAQQIQEKIRQQERLKILTAHATKIEAAIKAQEWDAAMQLIKTAQSEFPGDAVINRLESSLHKTRSASEIAALEKAALAGFANGDLDSVVQKLAETRTALSREAVWQSLWRELEQRKSYEAGLALANKAYAEREFGRAQDIIRWLLADAPDYRAEELLNAVMNEGRKQQVTDSLSAEAPTKTGDRSRSTRGSGELDTTVITGRHMAASLARSGKLHRAIEALERLASEHSESQEIRSDLEAAARELDRQQREQEEKLRPKGVRPKPPVSATEAVIPSWRKLYSGAAKALSGVMGHLQPGSSDITAAPRMVEFSAVEGKNPPTQEITLNELGTVREASTDRPWIKAVRTAKGVRIGVTSTILAPGEHTGTVRLEFRQAGEPPLTLPVTLKITPKS